MPVLLCIFLMNMSTLMAQDKVNVNVNSQGDKFEHFWSECVGAGRANEGLRAGWLEQILAPYPDYDKEGGTVSSILGY